jgi:hypothetical protein
MRPLRTLVTALVLGLLALGLAACTPQGPSGAQRLEQDMEQAAVSVAGVDAAEVDVIMNTSGNFITVKLVGTGRDASALADTLGAALPPILAATEGLESGSFAVSIFSPDDAVSAGPGALGYSGGNSLASFREFFVG